MHGSYRENNVGEVPNLREATDKEKQGGGKDEIRLNQCRLMFSSILECPKCTEVGLEGGE